MDHNTRNYLRDLAKKKLEYAHLPIMAERRSRWLNHNSLQKTVPLIVMESGGFTKDICPPLRCSGDLAYLEEMLQLAIVHHEIIDDDQVISPWFTLGYGWDMDIKLFNHSFEESRVTDALGNDLSHRITPLLENLDGDLQELSLSTFKANHDKTSARKRMAEDIFGDILPVKPFNDRMNWPGGLSSKICNHILGMENFLIQLIDNPEKMKQLYDFVLKDLLHFFNWLKSENLLTLNNDNVMAGAGSFGFTDELPQTPEGKAGQIQLRDLWLNMNSQETINVSPAMYEDIVFPSYYELAREFGLVYYGCCEPVHAIWDSCIKKIPNLRKVSISPWCDETIMGDRLRDARVIYSRKPHPRFLGLERFDKQEFTEHMRHTLTCAAGCHLEIIFRDIYTLNGDRMRPGNAVRIVRELIEEMWT